MEWSAVYQKKFLGSIFSIISENPNFAASQLYMQFSKYRNKKSKGRCEISILQDKFFCEVGRNVISKTFVCLMFDSFFFQNCKIGFESSVCKSNTEGRRRILCIVKIISLFAVQHSYVANCVDIYEMYWPTERFEFNWNLYGVETIKSDINWDLNWSSSVDNWDNKEATLPKSVFDNGFKLGCVAFEAKNAGLVKLLFFVLGDFEESDAEIFSAQLFNKV